MTAHAIAPPRPFDHLVLASRDLAAQAELYRRMGFQVGARNRHPWGTENHIVQFDGAFLELISTGGDFHRAPDADPHVFSFAGHVADYLARREGFAMLVLRSQDAKADAAHFRQVGIGDFEPFHFERRGKKPDGSETKVAFTLAFAESKLAPEADFFVCQQHYPENFWNPAFQVHPNGVSRILSVVMLADNPSDHAEFLSHFSGQREMVATSMGLEVDLGEKGGRIEVLTELAYRFRFGDLALQETPDPDPVLPLGPDERGPLSPRLAAVRFATDDPERIVTLLREADVTFDRRQGAIIVPPFAARGVALVFEKA